MMEDEINSQSEIVGSLIDKYFKNYCAIFNVPLEVNKITIVASGSSYNAGCFGKYFFENISDVQTQVEYASEFTTTKLQNFGENNVFIFISQSGYSKDTLEALKIVKNKNLPIIVITNNENSPMYELATHPFFINAGEEKSIAATKTFSASVMMLWLIAIKIAQNKHLDISNETKNIYSVKTSLDKTLKDIENLEFAAKELSKNKSFCLSSYGVKSCLCAEAALKIQETSYINALYCPIGEFIHGHFAILNKTKCFLTFISKNSTELEKEYLNKVLETYKTKSIVISDNYDDYNCDILVKIPYIDSNIGMILNMIVTIQMLALKTALILKRNVDKPDGLNKIVK